MELREKKEEEIKFKKEKVTEIRQKKAESKEKMLKDIES